MSGDALKALANHRAMAIKGGRYGGQDKLLVDAVIEIARVLSPQWGVDENGNGTIDSAEELERFTRLAMERGTTIPEARARQADEIVESARRFSLFCAKARQCKPCSGDGFICVGPEAFHPCGFCGGSGYVESHSEVLP